MQLRENAAIDLMTVTSMGLRIIPFNSQPVHTSYLYEMTATSAESNVLNISASLGLKTKVLTRFVANNPVAKFIQGELRKRNIQYEGPEVPAGGPWGYRHQINIADTGYGVRAPRVVNDRAGEVGCSLQASDFDLERIFDQEGCRILHVSGLIAALSKEASQCVLDVVRKAKKSGTRIGFDLNHRATFWENREEELREIFLEIASLADILIGNEEDYQLALGFPGPSISEPGIEAKIAGYQKMIDHIAEQLPNVQIFATTLREVESANSHLWGALLRAKGAWFVELPRPITIYDRIGGGDGFVGGLMYSVLQDWEPEKCLQFAWATGALVTTVIQDYGTPLDEKQVWDIYAGQARVVR